MQLILSHDKSHLQGIMCILVLSVVNKELKVRLRELDRNDLIGRKVYAEVPPRVEYFLTESGMALKP